jgi:hypothetical protein
MRWPRGPNAETQTGTSNGSGVQRVPGCMRRIGWSLYSTTWPASRPVTISACSRIVSSEAGFCPSDQRAELPIPMPRNDRPGAASSSDAIACAVANGGRASGWVTPGPIAIRSVALAASSIAMYGSPNTSGLSYTHRWEKPASSSAPAGSPIPRCAST